MMKSQVVVLFAAMLSSPCAGAADWPQWRGPLASGASPDADPPVVWHEGSEGVLSTNIRWKAEIPGSGASSPVVCGGRVYVTSAVDTGRAGDGEAPAEQQGLAGWQRRMLRNPSTLHAFAVFAVDRETGVIVWRTDVREEVPHEGMHTDGTWASASPICDGDRVYAFFGSRGLYALDLAGAVLWSRDFGRMKVRNRFGEGASPCLYGDTLIVNWDHEGGSFVEAVKAATGATVWRRERDEFTAWSTPVVVESGGRTQVLVSATQRIRSYDLADGSPLWECGGLTTNVVPSPVCSDEMAFFASGFRGSSLVAVRFRGAAGDITGDSAFVPWTFRRNTPYVPSPLLSGGRLYFLRVNDAKLTCLEAADGSVCYEAEDLGDIGRIYASPVAAGGRIYVAGRDGATAVVKEGARFRILAVNRLGDSFSASPAAAGRELYMRGARRLYCLSETGHGAE